MTAALQKVGTNAQVTGSGVSVSPMRQLDLTSTMQNAEEVGGSPIAHGPVGTWVRLVRNSQGIVAQPRNAVRAVRITFRLEWGMQHSVCGPLRPVAGRADHPRRVLTQGTHRQTMQVQVGCSLQVVAAGGASHCSAAGIGRPSGIAVGDSSGGGSRIEGGARGPTAGVEGVGYQAAMCTCGAEYVSIAMGFTRKGFRVSVRGPTSTICNPVHQPRS